MRILRTLCLTVTLLVPAMAQAQYVKEDLLPKAAQAAKICSDHMPDSLAAMEAFKQDGYRFEGIHHGYRIFTMEGRRLVAAISVTSAKRQACLISVSKMTPPEARALIQPWVAASNAKPVKPWHRNLSEAWIGTFRKGPVRMAVVKYIDLGPMRGAAIVAGAE